jgi:hypothetical protein
MSNTQCACCAGRTEPKALPGPLRFGAIDYLKALYSWVFSFQRTFAIEPGLYYTGGGYDREAPLLATCNYHMTVFLLWRTLRKKTVRLLVIDTEGINVWCSSGKGRFSASEILRQLDRYDRDLLTDRDTITLVLPKLSLSGVSLEELKEMGVTPRIGPVYRHDIPAYLDEAPLRDRGSDSYRFTLRDRLFTLVPSLAQFLKYGVIAAVALLAWDYFFYTGIYWQVIPIVAVVVTLYVVLFPLLPTRTFAVKGLALALAIIAAYTGWLLLVEGGINDAAAYSFYALFTAGTCLFFALSYTGNSGVSNYSLVKKEIIRYLPVTALIYLAALAVITLTGVLL